MCAWPSPWVFEWWIRDRQDGTGRASPLEHRRICRNSTQGQVRLTKRQPLMGYSVRGRHPEILRWDIFAPIALICSGDKGGTSWRKVRALL